MRYTTMLNGQERVVIGIAFVPGIMGTMIIKLDKGEVIRTSVSELVGRYGYFPESAYEARDLLRSLRSLVIMPLNTTEAERLSGGRKVFKDLGLTEEDFEAFSAIESRIKESIDLHDRLDGHDGWRPVEQGSFWQRR